VLWVIAAIGLCGLVLGLTCRVPALIAATLAAVVFTAGLAQWWNWSIGSTAIATLVAVLVIQCTYLLGLWLGASLHDGGTRARWRKLMNLWARRHDGMHRMKAPFR
jgi:hypothetical protein